MVSTGTASGAGASGPTSRLRSRSSRIACSRSTTSGSLPSSAARRRARSAGSAVRKTLTSASGATTVPMSRPSATQSPSARIRRCCSTSASRTAGSEDTREAASDTHGSRMRSVTSSPSSVTRSPSSSRAVRATAAASPPPSPVRNATARYIAPVSR